MFLEVTPQQRQMLVDLVEARIHEMRTEIRRARNCHYHDQLREQLHDLERVTHQLHESGWDVRC